MGNISFFLHENMHHFTQSFLYDLSKTKLSFFFVLLIILQVYLQIIVGELIFNIQSELNSFPNWHHRNDIHWKKSQLLQTNYKIHNTNDKQWYNWPGETLVKKIKYYKCILQGRGRRRGSEAMHIFSYLRGEVGLSRIYTILIRLEITELAIASEWIGLVVS